MTPALLRLAGEALYGARWQLALARALGVGGRRVRAWTAGEEPVPGWIPAELAALLAARGKEHAIVSQRIAAAIAGAEQQK